MLIYCVKCCQFSVACFLCTGDTTELSAEAINNQSSGVEPAAVFKPEAMDENKEVESVAPVPINEELPGVVTLDNKKPDAEGEIESVTVTDVTVNKDEAIAAENNDAESNMAVLRKQKNRIACQCGSANCRKYLF